MNCTKVNAAIFLIGIEGFLALNINFDSSDSEQAKQTPSPFLPKKPHQLILPRDAKVSQIC
jgi:hypothetical protein